LAEPIGTTSDSRRGRSIQNQRRQRLVQEALCR
jgi:hypothetical protein